jgi:hypothetical protein
MVTKRRRLAFHLVDDGVGCNDPPDKLASDRLRQRLRAAPSQGRRESTCDVSCQLSQKFRKSVPRTAKVRSGQDDPGAHDTDPDFAHARDGERKGLAVCAANGAKLVSGDDGGRIAGKRRGVSSEIAQQGCDQRTKTAPQRQAHEEAGTILGKARCQSDDRHSSDEGSYHSEPAFAQRCAETRLANQCRGRACPIGIVKLKPERHVQGEAHRGP